MNTSSTSQNTRFVSRFAISLLFVCVLAFTAMTIVPQTLKAQSTVGGGNTETTGGTVTGGNRPVTRPPEGLIKNPLKVDSIEQVIYLIVNIILRIGAIVSVLLLIWSGFLFIMAQGDVKKIGEAKKVFYYTIIGIAILFGATVLVEIIQGTVNSVLGTK